MALLAVGSFEVGFMLAQILSVISQDIITKPSISRELSSFERIFKKLYEDICSGTVSDRDEAVLAIQEHFTALTALTSSYRNIVE